MHRHRYVHGYEAWEAIRLQDQARTLADLLHADTRFPAGSRVLEVGCGVGAQTLFLAQNSTDARFTSIDISEESLARAAAAARDAGLANVAFRQADLLALPFEPGTFDHVFVCFVLEHLPRPVRALEGLLSMLSPRGSITVIEGDHGSTYFHPDSSAARRAVACQVELQRRAGGDALVGRQLFPLLSAAGFVDIHVSPRMVYVDASRPELVDGFVRRTFTAMVEGVRDPAVHARLISATEFDQGVRDLHRTAERDGVFCYTFFKARAFAPDRPEASE